MPFPETSEMEFDCGCALCSHKNIWNDVAGVRIRYCPSCGEQRVQYYEPTEAWEDTGRGKAGVAMSAVQQAKCDAATAKRAAGVTVENPKELAPSI